MAYQHQVMPLYLETKKAREIELFCIVFVISGERSDTRINQKEINHLCVLTKRPHYHNTTYFTAIP